MPNQYELTIYVKGGKGNKEDENLAGDKDEEKKKKDNEAEEGAQIIKAKAMFLMNTAKTLVVSKVGEYTRDSLLQRKINAAMDAAETAIAFAIDPVFGAVRMAISYGSQAIDYRANVSKQNSRLSVMGERAGYINRSRE